MEHTLRIQDGHVKFVYDDALVDLLHEGAPAVCRVSHVEPHPTKAGWLADMRPTQGPVLGLRSAVAVDPAQAAGEADAIAALVSLLTPFPTRAEALAAERAWLTENRGL